MVCIVMALFQKMIDSDSSNRFWLSVHFYLRSFLMQFIVTTECFAGEAKCLAFTSVLHDLLITNEDSIIFFNLLIIVCSSGLFDGFRCFFTKHINGLKWSYSIWNEITWPNTCLYKYILFEIISVHIVNLQT